MGHEIGLGLADECSREFGGLQGSDNVIKCRGRDGSTHGEDEDSDQKKGSEFFHGEKPPLSCHYFRRMALRLIGQPFIWIISLSVC